MEELVNVNEVATEEISLEEKEKKSFNRYKTASKVLMIISIILYFAVNGFLLAILLPYFVSGVDGAGEAIAMIFVIVFGFAILGTSGNVASMVLSIVGLILTAKRRKKGAKLSVLITFIVFTALPIVTWGTYAILIFA